MQLSFDIVGSLPQFGWAAGTAAQARPPHWQVGKALKIRRDQGNWLPELNETANFVLPIPLHAVTEPLSRFVKRDRDRAERIRLAGARSHRSENAVALALEIGVVRTRDPTDIGIPRCYLARMCNEGWLVKVGYGAVERQSPKAA